MSSSLWGDDFVVEKVAPKKIIKKAAKPKNVTEIKSTKNKKDIPFEDLIEKVKKEVYRILGKYAENTICIRDKDTLHSYIDKAIINGEISIDTETNNSLDPISCKLMGPCIYTPGQKQVYIPINHVNPKTLERLDNQLTEQDIADEFSRLKDTKIIMHNGKFDYKVIKCTCGIELKCYWDTMIAVRILNENEKRAALKEQYHDKIDATDEKYDIEHLFQGLEYAKVDPELFALYAATDAYKTHLLYHWQLEQFNKPGNERIKDILLNIEMPVMPVAAEMELTGVCIDSEYAKRLSDKYHKKLSNIQVQLQEQLIKYEEIIATWRMTEEANFHPKSKRAKKDGTFGEQKSKNEQLKNPPELTSPTQLAILLYDVLKCPIVDTKAPRSTGEEQLLKIEKETKNSLCHLILEQRGLEKLLSTYVDKIPQCVNPADNRLHASFNQVGTDTGRFSSQNPNLQNIPSHEKCIRLLFTAGRGNYEVRKTHNYFVLNKWDEVETDNGWKQISQLTLNDYIKERKIKFIEQIDDFNVKIVI